MRKVTTLILSGGEGRRLHPLTLTQCKPALTVGGKFRLIDFPIASAIHSGCQKIFVLTQFLATTLHRHLKETYDQVEILPCELKPARKEWYQGTADAVRHHLDYICEEPCDYFLILSGDQLYQMDFSTLLDLAKVKNADVVIASLPVDATLTGRMGIIKTDKEGRITHFQEKQPQTGPGPFLGSMGIYLFKRSTLIEVLRHNKGHDFGRDLIPNLVEPSRTFAYTFKGYWEDIGTIESFFAANLRFLDRNPPLDLHTSRLFSPAISLPAPKIYQTHIERSILGEGSHIEAERISNSLIGPKTVIGPQTTIETSYILGSSPIGKNCRIFKSIIDEQVSLGDHVELCNAAGHTHYDCPTGPLIRDGIIVVPRGTKLPANYRL